MTDTLKIESRIAYFGHKCWICGGEYEFMDHIIPVTRGGADWPANLRPICKSCNSRRGNKLIHTSRNLSLDRDGVPESRVRADRYLWLTRRRDKAPRKRAKSDTRRGVTE